MGDSIARSCECEWKVSVHWDDCHVRSFLFLYLRPKMRFDLRLYSICILSRLLTSLKDAHRNKLLIDLLCSLSRQLTIASQVFYFLSFFLFFFLLIIKVPSNLSFTPSRPICWGQMLWFFSFTSGRDNIQGWKAPYLQWISVAAQGLAAAAAPHHHCHSYVLFCTMSYLLIYSPSPRCPRLPLTSYLSH